MLACFFKYVSPHTIYKYYQLYGIFINVFITKGLFQNGFQQKNYINILFVEKNLCKKGAAGEKFFKIDRQNFKI